MTDAISLEMHTLCVEGPRLSEQNASIFATFVSGCAAGMGAEARCPE